QCLACALEGLIGVAAKPQDLRGIAAAADTGIVSCVGKGELMMSVRIIDCEAVIEMSFGCGVIAHEELCGPLAMMRFEQQALVISGLREGHAFMAECVG